MALVNIKPPQQTYIKSISRFIPPQQFEWISGIRKSFISLAIYLLLAIVLSPVKLFGLVAVFLVNAAIFSFYTDCEPINMLTAISRSGKEILRQKIFYSIKNILILNLPFLIINSIFNPDFIYINLGFLIYMCLLSILAITAKYNSYVPNTRSTAASIQLAFCATAIVFPPAAILSVFFLYKNYAGAIKQLAFYINDRD